MRSSKLNRFVSLRLAPALLLLLGLSACENENAGVVTDAPAGGSRIEMRPPQRIAQSRMINPDDLRIRVTVGSREVAMEPTIEGVQTGTIRLQEGQQETVLVEWSEQFGDAPLKLASADKPIIVRDEGAGQQQLVFNDSDYNYQEDDDQDGSTNFDERVVGTDPRDPNDPIRPPEQVPVVVRVQLPDARILDNNALLGTITPFGTLGDKPINLIREGNTWVGQSSAAENSNAFATVTFYQEQDQALVLATAKFGKDVGTDGTEFNFDTARFESDIHDQDTDNIANLDEVLNGSDPFDSNSPEQNPCDISNFEPGCTFDTDGDGKPDSQETQTTDTDQDGTPNYQESSLEDKDNDGRNAELDIDDEDACVPSTTNEACTAAQLDTDNDGETDAQEGTVDSDGDGIPDFRESSILDNDNDGLSNEADSNNTDPCLPEADNDACGTQQLDTDNDGETDLEEGDGDSDRDGIPDFQESSILDDDNDGFSNEADIANTDPCRPNTTNDACVGQQLDTDNDGESDIEEGTGDSDRDGIPDFRESSILDDDDDGLSNEADIANADPCRPSAANEACEAQQLDTDLDGKTDLEEGTVDTDMDGIPDFRESSILDDDDDGLSNEADIANADPCRPSAANEACEAQQLDTDLDGKTDAEEGTVDTDMDGIPDFRESSILDDDNDGLSNEADIDNADPCIPSATSPACLAVDTDSDTVPDATDNCPLVANTDQIDTNGDTQGDACDPDDDGDGVVDATDNCRLIENPAQSNTDGDALGNACDLDDDNDEVLDLVDNCATVVNTDQANNDGDDLGDVCDPDDDNDGILDGLDNCPLVANPDQDPSVCLVDP